MKQMYKVTFSYKEDDPRGGNTRFTGWRKEIVPMSAEDDSELQSKIANFKNSKNWHIKHIEVVDITKL